MTTFSDLPDEEQAPYYEAAHDILHGMTEDDFTDACDNADILNETAEYLYEFSRARGLAWMLRCWGAMSNTEPTIGHLKSALLSARAAKGDRAELRRLRKIRSKKTTWVGEEELQVRREIDGLLLDLER